MLRPAWGVEAGVEAGRNHRGTPVPVLQRSHGRGMPLRCLGSTEACAGISDQNVVFAPKSSHQRKGKRDGIQQEFTTRIARSAGEPVC
jgi:hypothetical protein